jgi:hypothetical protein
MVFRAKDTAFNLAVIILAFTPRSREKLPTVVPPTQ